MIGKVLGQYQISEKLGQGGMGIVWKAYDARLDRFVALKTLSAETVADPERKRRFAQEAKSASALNHPNIVHIYDIAEVDGMQFIAMEYVPGKTLEQLIGRKGLRLNEVLKYAVQIADALTKAHSAGIIHRDLKPSNIMVSEDGLVKVLDFGLAKLAETATSEFDETVTATEPKGPRTEEGKIVGTTAFMSPEQAEGKKLDGRSDIFSFGSVLYEMISGRRAFQGDSRLSTLSAILKDDPKPLNSVLHEVPRDLEKIISQCLRKNPERRFQHMDDLKVALLDLKEESDSGKLSTISDSGVTVRRRRSRLVLAGCVVSVLLIAGAGLWLRFLRPLSPGPAPRTVPLTSYPGWQRNPAFSRDGKQIAFSWDGENRDNFDIYVKLVDTGSPLRLTTNPAPEILPAWSPDGRYVAFYQVSDEEHGAIIIVPALGGVQRTVAHTASFCQGLSWSPDGRSLAIVDRPSSQGVDSIFLLSISSGEKRRITSPPDGYMGDCSPVFSPDGRAVGFLRYKTSVGAAGDLNVVPIDQSKPKGEPRRISPGGSFIGWDWTADRAEIVASSGRFFGQNGLWIIPVSGGAPRRLAVASENAYDVSVSRTGNRLAYEHMVSDSNIWRMPGPNSATQKSMPAKWIASKQDDLAPQFSPDGKWIAFISTRSGNFEIWVCRADGNSPVQLTSFGGSSVGSPRWSPDNRWITFDSTNEGSSDIYVISVDGGSARRLTTEASNDVRPSWSRNGHWIYFGSNRSGGWQVWKVPAEGGATIQVTRRGGREAFESADGNFIYYAKLATPGIWRIPVGGGEETQILHDVRMGYWALTEQGIFVIGKGSAGRAIKFYDFGTQQLTTIREFDREVLFDISGSTALSVSRDARWILYTQVDQSGSDLMLVENYR